MDISAVIVSFNSEEFLKENITSLIGQTVPFKEILVVDNDSGDDSPDIIEGFARSHANVHALLQGANTGYAAAANTGILSTSSSLVLVANADTILDENFNAEVLDLYRKDPGLALLSPLLLRFDRKTVDSAGQTYSKSLHPVEIGFNRPLETVDTTEKEVFSVCGAATVFRRDALETLALNGDFYDEDFFIFWEDFDIGWRAQLLGLKVLFSPRAKVYHYRSATLERNFRARFSLALARPGFIKFHLVKNRYLTLVKNFRFKTFYWTLPFILIKDLTWVGMLTFFSPKIIIPLMESRSYLKRALVKRKMLKEKVRQAGQHDQ